MSVSRAKSFKASTRETKTVCMSRHHQVIQRGRKCIFVSHFGELALHTEVVSDPPHGSSTREKVSNDFFYCEHYSASVPRQPRGTLPHSGVHPPPQRPWRMLSSVSKARAGHLSAHLCYTLCRAAVSPLSHHFPPAHHLHSPQELCCSPPMSRYLLCHSSIHFASSLSLQTPPAPSPPPHPSSGCD